MYQISQGGESKRWKFTLSLRKLGEEAASHTSPNVHVFKKRKQTKLSHKSLSLLGGLL